LADPFKLFRTSDGNVSAERKTPIRSPVGGKFTDKIIERLSKYVLHTSFRRSYDFFAWYLWFLFRNIVWHFCSIFTIPIFKHQWFSYEVFK